MTHSTPTLDGLFVHSVRRVRIPALVDYDLVGQSMSRAELPARESRNLPFVSAAGRVGAGRDSVFTTVEELRQYRELRTTHRLSDEVVVHPGLVR